MNSDKNVTSFPFIGLCLFGPRFSVCFFSTVVDLSLRFRRFPLPKNKVHIPKNRSLLSFKLIQVSSLPDDAIFVGVK